MVSIAQPVLGDEEVKAVNEVLRSGMLAQGTKVAALEELAAQYCGTKYAFAVSSGTAALHCALHAAGIQAGDEVITVPFSFIATINPILMVGARPVLVDIDPRTFNIDVSKIEQAITPKTKAIIPVDLYGQPYDYEELQSIAKAHNLVIIEDACQAIGATYKKQKAGTLGDLGCFSLYATKNIMCGEGGIVTTNDDFQATAIRRFRQHGMSGPYQYEELGYNYRLTDLQGAIALEQLRKVDSFNEQRQKNAALLSKGLKDIPGLILPYTAPGRTHVYHQYTLRITPEFGMTREELAVKLREQEIGTGIYYPKPLHAYPHIAALGYKLGDFPESERAATEVISLPVHPSVTEEEISKIVTTIREIAHV